MVFSEDSRVNIPCILHLVRLGYRYLSLKDTVLDVDTNIFPTFFNEAIVRINPGWSADNVTRLLAFEDEVIFTSDCVTVRGKTVRRPVSSGTKGIKFIQPHRDLCTTVTSGAKTRSTVFESDFDLC